MARGSMAPTRRRGKAKVRQPDPGLFIRLMLERMGFPSDHPAVANAVRASADGLV